MHEQPYGGPPQPWEQPAQQHVDRQRRITRIAAVVTVLIGVIVGIAMVMADGDDGPKGTEITKARYEAGGLTWPLTVDHGLVSCEQQILMVFTAPDGTRYGLNGVAQTRLGLPSIDTIWADNPEFPGIKVSDQHLMSQAQLECKYA